MVTMTREIQVEDYPEFDPKTADGREQLTLLAFDIALRNPTLCHFIFKRGAEIIGELYKTNMLEEEH